MKKAQVIGQVFIYIITALIIGLVLLFGIRAVMQLVSSAEGARIVTFQRDFTNKLNGASDYDSIDSKPFSVPGDFSSICFIQIDQTAPMFADKLPTIVLDSWNDGVLQNIFLIGSKDFVPMYVKGLRVDRAPAYWVCKPIVSGVVTGLRFRGYGAGVIVEEI